MIENLIDKVAKYNRLFIIINIILILSASSFLVYKYIISGEIFKKDISITGGVQISLIYKKGIPTDINLLENELSNYFKEKVYVNIIKDKFTLKPEYIIIQGKNITLNKTLSFFESRYNVKYAPEETQILYFNPYFGKSIFFEFTKAVLIVLGLIVFIIYLRLRNKITSFVVLSTLVFDLVMTAAVLSLIQFPISTVAFVAFLMILGYGIDNNILVATNYLKEKDMEFSKKMAIAVKTGLLMEFSTLIVLILMWMLIESSIIKEIATILTIALIFDAYFLVFGNIPMYKFFEERVHGK